MHTIPSTPDRVEAATRQPSTRLPFTEPDRSEIGRRLGFDLYLHRRRPDEDAWPSDVHEGYCQARFGDPATRPPDRHERKCLQLRLQAHRRDRAFDPAITPDWLRRIDVGHCPVTRRPLTHGLRAPTDGSVDRVNNDGAYAPSNLAVMSTAANRAKRDRGFDEVLALARAGRPTDGLLPVEWLRLAGLMLGPCFATDPRRAPTIPLLAALPQGLAVTVMQQTQHVFASEAGSTRGKNRLIKRFAEAAGTEASRHRLGQLADRVHDAAKGLEHPGDVWLTPAAMQALEHWRAALDDEAWGRVGAIGRAFARSRRIDADRLATWRLPHRGYRTS